VVTHIASKMLAASIHDLELGTAKSTALRLNRDIAFLPLSDGSAARAYVQRCSDGHQGLAGRNRFLRKKEAG
ncbi:MAG TPA: hypothetical protein VKE94_19275, partial [Gemmataceae bacterium]|nr:hypothetical protein [Gemmataceae bacterium]